MAQVVGRWRESHCFHLGVGRGHARNLRSNDRASSAHLTMSQSHCASSAHRVSRKRSRASLSPSDSRVGEKVIRDIKRPVIERSRTAAA